MPAGIASVLHVLNILLGYGRHLADTVRDRATIPSFTSLAACFGTARLPVILAHLQRGILRAIALERVLLARAAKGRDIEIPPVRVRSAGAAQHAAPAGPAAAQPAAAHASATHPPCQGGWQDDPLHHMPTLEELEARARRRPIGQTIIEICIDLAVVPGFCTGPFWNALFEVITWYDGNLVTLTRERARREAAFEREQDKAPTRSWRWWDATRDMLREALGFRIGEMPALPIGLVPAACGPAAAAAARPP
jgi:hypothetical protein